VNTSEQNSFVLEDLRIATMDPDTGIVEGDLAVRDGEIAAVGEVSPELKRELPTREIDGDVLLPGFVQCHIHLCQTLLRNQADDMVLIDWLSEHVWPYEASLAPEDLYWSARLGLAELALGGTTTLLDMGTVEGTDAIGEAVEDSGMRAFIGKCMMDRGTRPPSDLIEETDESLQESLRLLDRWDGAADGRIRYAFAPRFAVSCSERLLRDVVAAAADHGVPIHTHASETEFENEFTREHHGERNIEFLHEIGMCDVPSVFAHGVHVSDEECRTLADSETAVCHCPSSNLKLASGLANMPRYDEFGVDVSLGADGAPCNNNLDAFVEMRLAALSHKPHHGPEAMPAERVLKLATIDGARALDIDDEVGSIAEGKQADLVALDLSSDPATAPGGGNLYSRIVYSAQRANVTDVFAGGRQVVDGGALVGIDREELLSEADAAHDRVVERMNRR
jgi:5-methylthioadenosine/S-adenosylhomocysteine deaminase